MKLLEEVTIYVGDCPGSSVPDILTALFDPPAAILVPKVTSAPAFMVMPLKVVNEEPLIVWDTPPKITSELFDVV